MPGACFSILTAHIAVMSAMDSHYYYVAGDNSLLISMPHIGVEVPAAIAEVFTPAAKTLPDTDFQVDLLYDFAPELGCSLLGARYSRYVVDLNRPPDDAPLYATTTSSLVPHLTFAGEPIYRSNRTPDATACKRRVAQYWRPYHTALAAALARLKKRHGYAVLLDAHSIRSVLPRLFTGRLPDLNLGTNNGLSAAPDLIDRAWQALASDGRFTRVRDGRFRGGYITRHYGNPADGVHAIQIELAQDSYMDENKPNLPDAARQAPLKAVLRNLVERLITWRP